MERGAALQLVLCHDRRYGHEDEELVTHNPQGEEYRDCTRIVDRVRKGSDLWDERGQTYKKVSYNKNMPETINNEKERFKCLLDREGHAEFMDYKSNGNGAAKVY